MVSKWLPYAPTDEQAHAAVRAGAKAARDGESRNSVPDFLDESDDKRTRDVLKLCWVRGYALTMQHMLQEKYGTPPG